VFVGATNSLHRDFFKTVGGLDTDLRLGSDTEFAYRLAQAGAVFVPETSSSAWHLGMPQMLQKWDEGRHQRVPYIAQRVPLHGMRRTAPPRAWRVPLVDIAIDVQNATAAEVDACVAPVLAGQDARITLVTGQGPAPQDRASILAGDGAQLRLVEEAYDGEPRVRIAAETPAPDPVVPYRLLLPKPVPLRPSSVAKLIASIERSDAGLLLAALPDAPPARLERTAAFARARHITDGGGLDQVVAGIWGAAQYAGLAAREPESTVYEPGPPDAVRRFARRFFDARQRARLRALLRR
jgi:hypothetical protein